MKNFVQNVFATFATFRKLELILSSLVLYYIFRVAQCKNWKDLSLRHCNAYHSKDGPWKAVREKNKELNFKRESLLELRKKLRDERKEKRKEISSQSQGQGQSQAKAKPKMDLSVS